MIRLPQETLADDFFGTVVICGNCSRREPFIFASSYVEDNPEDLIMSIYLKRSIPNINAMDLCDKFPLCNIRIVRDLKPFVNTDELTNPPIILEFMDENVLYSISKNIPEYVLKKNFPSLEIQQIDCFDLQESTSRFRLLSNYAKCIESGINNPFEVNVECSGASMLNFNELKTFKCYKLLSKNEVLLVESISPINLDAEIVKEIDEIVL